MSIRRHRQDGTTTGEYIMVVVFVALLVGALGASGIGEPIRGAVRTAFCTISPDGTQLCYEGEVGDEDYRLPDCTLASSGEGLGGSLTLFSGKLGADGSYELVEVGDGDGPPRYEVRMDLEGSLGAEIMTGGHVTADGLGTKQGRSGSLSVSGGATYAPTFPFDSRAEAEQFVDDTRALITGPADDAWDWETLIPVWGAARIPINQVNRVRNYDPPDPVRTRIEGGVTVEAEGTLHGAGAGLEGDFELGHSIGAELDHNTGATTIFYKLDGEVSAAMGMTGAGGSGGLDSQVVVGVTYDDDWSAQKLSLGWTGTASGGVSTPDLDALWFADGTALPADISDAASIGLDVSSEQTWTLEATADLDLTDPRLRDPGMDFLGALSRGDLSGVGDAGGQLVDYVVDDSDLLVQYRAGTVDEFGIDIAGGHVLAFGLGAKYTSTEEDLRDAWYRQGGYAWDAEVCGV